MGDGLGVQKLRNVTIFVLISFLMAPTTPAVADVTSICDDVSELKHIQIRSDRAQSIDNPLATFEILNRLEKNISASVPFYAKTGIIRVESNLFKLVAELGQSDNDQRLQSGSLGPTMYWSLSAIMDDLILVRNAFGCEFAPKKHSRSEKLPSDQSSSSLGRNLSGIVDISVSKAIYSWVPFILAVMALSGIFFRRVGRRDDRHACSIFLHVVYGEQCTVTRMVDISPSGLKMEAAAKDVKKKWVHFNFGGHKVEGRIVWRNKLYAGVKFRKRLSNAVLDDVMATNCKPMNESRIEKTSTACFHEGCHLACPLHLPTAISLKSHSSGVKNRSQDD